MKNLVRVLVVITFLFSPLLAFAASDNTFINVTVGFSVTKPDSWQFLTVEQNLENLKRMQLNDEQFREVMVKYSTAPLVAMMKYPEPYDDLNPSLKVNVKPLGNLKGMDPKGIINLVSAPLKSVFKDFEITVPPMDTTVSGLRAGYAQFNYSLAIPDGRSFPTVSELWIVPRGEYFFIIGAGTRQDEKTGTRAEIQSILKTVKIDK
jgi:hypothetical protein